MLKNYYLSNVIDMLTLTLVIVIVSVCCSPSSLPELETNKLTQLNTQSMSYQVIGHNQWLEKRFFVQCFGRDIENCTIFVCSISLEHYWCVQFLTYLGWWLAVIVDTKLVACRIALLPNLSSCTWNIYNVSLTAIDIRNMMGIFLHFDRP